MSKQSFIKLELFNILGDRIETIVAQNYPEGKHSIIFDRKNLPSGIYLYRFSTNGFSESKLMNIE
jgi:serine protease AprX